MLELTLLPVAALVYIFAYPPLFCFGSAGGASILWILTAFVSQGDYKQLMLIQLHLR